MPLESGNLGLRRFLVIPMSRASFVSAVLHDGGAAGASRYQTTAAMASAAPPRHAQRGPGNIASSAACCWLANSFGVMGMVE
uniref:hypothetical protein n=1 Tax=Castellaniella defragrans TaxID=75697 RepID=UPI0033423800